VNERLRLVLCGACVAIGAVHAPVSTHVLAEDLAGTYGFVVRAERGQPSDARVAATQGRLNAETHDDHGEARAATARR
jgi:acyl-coenzyme A synthetase/AMP-(fatty) acid ligase